MTGYLNHHHLIGDYTVCKSSQEPNKVYFQIQTPTYEHEICFPTNREGESLLYIGSKRCIRPTSATSIYPLSFSIDRPGFGNFQMNSVIFMPYSMHSFTSPVWAYIRFQLQMPFRYAWTSLLTRRSNLLPSILQRW